MVHLVARVADPYGLAENGQAKVGLTENGEAAFGLAEDVSGESSRAAEAGLIDGLPAKQESGSTAPLAVGLFVEALIQGQSIERAFVIPRDALREGNLVYVVDSEQRIQFRKVEVLRMERENIIVSAGLEPGDQICITPLRAAINGMRVRVQDSNYGEGGGESLDPSLDPSSEHQGLAERPIPPAETLQ